MSRYVTPWSLTVLAFFFFCLLADPGALSPVAGGAHWWLGRGLALDRAEGRVYLLHQPYGQRHSYLWGARDGRGLSSLDQLVRLPVVVGR